MSHLTCISMSEWSLFPNGDRTETSNTRSSLSHNARSIRDGLSRFLPQFITVSFNNEIYKKTNFVILDNMASYLLFFLNKAFCWSSVIWRLYCIGLLQKKKKNRKRVWNFQGYQRNTI